MARVARGNLTFARKIMVGWVTDALGIVVAAGIAYVKTSSQLNSEARDKLVGLRDSRAYSIERYLQGIQADIESQAGSPAVRGALRAFDDAWRDLDGNANNCGRHEPHSGQNTAMTWALKGSSDSGLHLASARISGVI